MADVSRVTQLGAEFALANGPERITQLGIEMAIGPEGPVRVTQVGAEFAVVVVSAVIACLSSTTHSITIEIVAGVDATDHAAYISQDPLFTPSGATLVSASIGADPGTYTFTGLDEAGDYYIIIRATIGAATVDSATLHCQTAQAGAAPAYVCVSVTGATTATVYPEDVGAAATTVYYEWKLSATSGWVTPIGSTSKTGAGRFSLDLTGLATALHTVRVRYEYAAGLSYWTEREWDQDYSTLSWP